MKPDGLPEPPAEALTLFGDRLPLAEEYAALLAGPGTERGLLGPREVPRLWERHLLNCAALGQLVPEGADVADVGSGAGLPGLALAIARPDVQVTLIEPLLRRVTFLHEAVAALGLDVEVLRARAEECHGDRQFTVVTSRAVAPLDRLARWSLPLVSPGGLLLAMKGSSAADEVQQARGALARLGGRNPRVLTVEVSARIAPTTVVRVDLAPPRS